MTDIKTIGFIGIGNMGRPMAANLVKGGYQVVAYDVDGKRAAQFAEDAGAKSAATLAELGKQVDAIVTMLPTGKEVRACLLETEGGALAANLPKGALVIDMSSADPVGTRADPCGPRQARPRVRRCAGVRRRAARHRRLARDHDRRRRGGGRGREARARQDGHAAVRGGRPGQRPRHEGAEQFRRRHRRSSRSPRRCWWARSSASIPATMVDVMNASTGKSFNTEHVAKQHVVSRQFASGFALGLLAKDVGIAADLAKAIDVDSPLIGLSSALFDEARDKVGGEKDHTLAYTYWESRDKKAAAE